MWSFVLFAAVAAAAFADDGAVRSPYLRDGDPEFVNMPDEKGNIHFVDLRYIPRLDPIDGNNVTFHVFTPYNKDDGYLVKANEFEKLVAFEHYDPTRPNFFTVHGWTGSANSTSVELVKDALLELHNINVFSVDYAGIANLFYTMARSHVNTMAELIANFIRNMIAHYNIGPSNFVLMGHSLGGQLVARIGQQLDGQLAVIIGLDPAAPMFPPDVLEERLDPTDAVFVQVVHSNAGFLGFRDSCGHADFWPNGGIKQTDCGLDLIGMCSHFLVKDFAPESVLTGGFVGRICNSYQSYLAGSCAANAQSWFAGWPIDTSARGDYYLRTNGQPPFALG